MSGRVLVTGASGFIGSRVCEHLRLGRDVPVRALVHDPARAARVARLDVELLRGDLTDSASLERAVAGCDAVVHCAYGTTGTGRERRTVTGMGAGLMAEAARRAGVSRFVHLSSVSVWGFDPGPGPIDEATPVVGASKHPYVAGKRDAEREVAAAAERGLPAVVLRPTNVFGPFSPLFTIGPVRQLRDGGVALVGDGSTPANTVYVDNVVHAIQLALEDDRAVGETFVVSDEDGVTWRQLYEAYARMASPPWEVRSLPLDQVRGRRSPARALARAAAESRLVRRAVAHRSVRALARRGAQAVLRPPQSGLPSEELSQMQTSTAVFRAEKIRSRLGYLPPVSFELAMRLTEEWLRFARFL